MLLLTNCATVKYVILRLFAVVLVFESDVFSSAAKLGASLGVCVWHFLELCFDSHSWVFEFGNAVFCAWACPVWLVIGVQIGVPGCVRVQAGVQLGVFGKSSCPDWHSSSQGCLGPVVWGIMLQTTPKKSHDNPNTKNTRNCNRKPTNSQHQQNTKSKLQKTPPETLQEYQILVLLHPIRGCSKIL